MVAHLVAERPRAARLAGVHVSQVTSHEMADENWELQNAEQVLAFTMTRGIIAYESGIAYK